MKLGLGSYAYFWNGGVPGWPQPQSPMTALGLVERASSLGLKLVQIADNMPVDQLPRSVLEALKKRSEFLGVDLELGTSGMEDRHLQRQIELCTILGARILRIVVDTADRHPSPDEIVRAISGHLDSLHRAQLVLAIENHDRFPAATLADIVRRISSPQVGVCLDTVNSFGSLEGPQVVVNTLSPLVVSLHLKDFTIRRSSHKMGFLIEGAPAGEGQLDVPWLLRQLHQAGRDVNAILELWPPPEPQFEETLKKEDEWVARSIRNLRPLIPN